MLRLVVLLLCSLASVYGSRSCVEERENAEAEYALILSESTELGFFYVPECDEEGRWTPLQADSNNKRWCVEVDTGEVVSQQSELLTSCSGCLAARLIRLFDVQVAQQSRADINNVHFPECQEVYPELYEEKQCWVGYFNACWCVDTFTGEPTSMPSESNEVSCESERRHPISWCWIMENLTKSYFDAYYAIKEQAVEKQQQAKRALGNEVDKARTSGPDVQFTVKCDEEGHFAKEQCLDGICWCVDTITGGITDDCNARQKRNAAPQCLQDRGAQLEAYYGFILRGVMLEHITIPKCSASGSWNILQCANQTVNEHNACWCVDEFTGYTTTHSSSALHSCDSCLAHVMRSEYGGIEDYTQCDESGKYYLPIQCNMEDECWCVDHLTGDVLYYTRDGDVTGEDCETYDLDHSRKLGRD